MSNELTKDAEESQSIEKTASEQTENTNPAPQAGPQAEDAVETGSSEAGASNVGAAPAPAHESAPAEETGSAPPAAEAPTEAAPIEPQAAQGESPAPAADTTEPGQPVESADTAPTAQSKPPEPTVRIRTIAAPQGGFSPAPPAPTSPAPQASASVPKAPADEAHGSTDIDFGAILEQFEQEQTVFHPGQLVNGKVVGTTDRGVLVDFGYKSEGFVPAEELTGEDGKLSVSTGDTLDVVIRSIHSGDGAPQLSRTEALSRKVWDEIESAYQSGTPITGKVVDKTKGGLKIDINGVEAFLPGSQIDSRPIRGLDTYMGEEIEARVIKFSRRRNNIVLSRKVITDEIINAQKAETMSKIDVGYIVEGTVKNLTEYGAFVDIGGIDGLLHVTDMSWGRIQHPADMFKSGQHDQFKVLKMDREKEKISLGYKQLQPDPWSTVVEVYPVNAKVNGKISSVTDYGVFVELEPGVEGLVHVSEISWSRRAQSPKKLFQKNQEVEVQVLGVDTVEKRISLGMKQFQENPWDSVADRYPVGSRVHGRVRNITDFGAFVELEEGIDGLVHVSDISWGKKIKHPKDVLKKDQEVEAIVTSIDRRGQRLSLSMKDLTPSAWEGFVATHRPGDVVRGKVSRFTNFGIFVELGEGLEGLCHISELSDERVNRPEDVASLGQEMDFKILRIEPQEQKIGLSHRAVGKEDEPVVDTRVYSSEAKGGMASLGELANLKRGGTSEPAQPRDDRKKGKKVGGNDAQPIAVATEEPAAEAAPSAESEASEAPVAEAPVTDVPGADATASPEGSTEEPAGGAASEPSAPEATASETAAGAPANGESTDGQAAQTAASAAPDEVPTSEAAAEPVSEPAETTASSETAADASGGSSESAPEQTDGESSITEASSETEGQSSAGSESVATEAPSSADLGSGNEAAAAGEPSAEATAENHQAVGEESEKQSA